MSSPDGVNTGQKYVQSQVKLGIANKKRLLYISLDTVWGLAVLAGQVKGPKINVSFSKIKIKVWPISKDSLISFVISIEWVKLLRHCLFL